ncbi:MAG: alpha/beta hydrolase [Rhizobiales bacterium]|nr:alpha/beta hydrolase [Hyphomicrobiales bacterium]
MRFQKIRLVSVIAATLLLAGVAASAAQEVVSIGGSRALLLRPANPQASAILMPGGDGGMSFGADGTVRSLQRNQLVRTREAYRAAGLAVLVVDADVDLSAAVKYMADIKRPVSVIATSRGTLRAAQGIARGARPDALVLTSGFLSNESGSSENVMNILHSPRLLPPTLVIHHRRDGCRFTRPAGVDPFIRWSAGKARVVWLDGGADNGKPCRAQSHHGFKGLDGKVVAIASRFRK